MKNLSLAVLRVRNMLLTGLGRDRVTVNAVDTEDAVGKFLGMIFWVITMVGAGMVIWGGYEFWQTLNDNNGDKRNGAIIKIVGGFGMIGLKVLLTNMGVIS